MAGGFGSGVAIMRFGAGFAGGGAGASGKPLGTICGSMEELLKSSSATTGGSVKGSGAPKTGAAMGGGGVKAAGGFFAKKHELGKMASTSTAGIATKECELGRTLLMA